uniref:DNA-directed RNA polymerase subunit beta n=1 Tax=Hepatozoon canis TaxID=110120 RepID=A0A3S8TEK3_9APIC|nr:RNA polymerase B [Hepatozoon canis]
MTTQIPYNYIFYPFIKNEYKSLFLINIYKYLKFTFLKKNNFIIKSYPFNYEVKITNIQSNTWLDCIQKYNYLIQIKLPIIIKNNITKTFIYKKFLYYTLPIPNFYSIFIINGIKRILLPNLVNYEGINFIIHNKYYINIYIINIILFKYNILFYVELDIINYSIYFIIPLLKVKINFIYLLYFLKINNKTIIKLSNYGKSFFLKTILVNSIKYHTNNIKKEIKVFSIILKNRFQTYKFNNKNLSITIELIKILDLLIDFSLNKISNKNHFGITKINISIKNLFSFLNTYNIFLYHNIEYFINNNKIINNYYNLYKEFLLINPLFRILDETNIVSEISDLFKIINYNFNTTSLIIRDFKINQLNNLCILHTSDGISSGILMSLTLNTFYDTKSNSISYFYFQDILTYKVPVNININRQEYLKIILMELYNKKLNYFNKFILPIFWYSNFSYTNCTKNTININFKHLLGPSENLIPFIFFTDPTRCLMGAKMQSQSIPILGNKKLLVLTGAENYMTYNYGLLYSIQEGVVTYVTSTKIIVKDILNREITYLLNNNKMTTQLTVKHLYPIVWVGERVLSGQLLVSSNYITGDEITTGSYIKVLYGSYFGYDYEDSIIASQKLLYNNIFTSLHIYVYEASYYYNYNGYEYSSLLIPNISIYFKRNLNIYGIIKEGSCVLDNDIIISKIVRRKVHLTINKLCYFISFLFGSILYNIINLSIKNSNNTFGKIIKVEIFLKNYLNIRVFIGNINLLKIGDKVCGRHGNKGIISYVSKNVDLPYMKNGEYPDIITGSLGVPSRMNLGQLYEGLFGIKGFFLDTRLLINNFINKYYGINYLKYYLYKSLLQSSCKTGYHTIYNAYDPGRVLTRDGRSGEKLKGALCFGIVHYFKLIHMIKDKVHSRTVGNYTNITQQPVRGKSRNGGQRFGEMEVWSLEAFGSAYLLRELLTSRSDDINSRNSLYNMILNNTEYVLDSSISEPFKIIIKELKGLSLNINLSILYPNLFYKMKQILF